MFNFSKPFVLSSLILLSSWQVAYAQYDDDLGERIELAAEIYEISNPFKGPFEQRIADMTSELATTILGSQEAAFGEKGKHITASIARTAAKRLQRTYKKEIISLIAETFTQPELRANIKFLNSAYGQTIINKNLEISKRLEQRVEEALQIEFTNLTQQISERLQLRLNAMMEEMPNPETFDSDEAYKEQFLDPLLRKLMTDIIIELEYE